MNEVAAKNGFQMNEEKIGFEKIKDQLLHIPLSCLLLVCMPFRQGASAEIFFIILILN